jgi:hypothetical protein
MEVEPGAMIILTTALAPGATAVRYCKPSDLYLASADCLVRDGNALLGFTYYPHKGRSKPGAFS